MRLMENPLLGCIGGHLRLGQFVETHPADRSSSFGCSMHSGSPGSTSNALSCNHMTRKSTPSRCHRSWWFGWMAFTACFQKWGSMLDIDDIWSMAGFQYGDA
jgi:hypothetical protein